MGLSKTGPTINKGGSKQDYSTPKDFIEAVVSRFGPLAFDLAASADNTKAPQYFDEEDNALSRDWSKLEGNLWLNPPFSDIAPWAAKCVQTQTAIDVKIDPSRRILFLVPASVGSDWYRFYVRDFAYVLALSPRLKFEGCEDAYPKDCILAVYGHGFRGFDTWRWKL